MSDNRYVGIFDSGLGGLSVIKNIINLLPNENIIYLGDIARIPYGTKSSIIIEKFSIQAVKFLIKKKVKVIIIACNTISAIAKNIIKEISKTIPILDVITAGVFGLNSINNLNIAGVIATPMTINNNAYALQIHQTNPSIKIYSNSCGLFVPMIEEGFITGKIVDLIIDNYLSYFNNKNIQALILGCTHYSIIKESIFKRLNKNLVDPSLEITKLLRSLLIKNKILNISNLIPRYKFYVTDIPFKFKSIGELFLQKQIQDIEVISLEES